MKRRKFIKGTSLATVSTCLSPCDIISGKHGEKHPELKKHKIKKIEKVVFTYHWPRHVGKNAIKDNHGQHHKSNAFKVYTDQGATGWALGSNRVEDHDLVKLQGRSVSELISPADGVRQDISPHLDLALHDLMGVILDTPVYKLIDARGTSSTPHLQWHDLLRRTGAER